MQINQHFYFTLNFKINKYSTHLKILFKFTLKSKNLDCLFNCRLQSGLLLNTLFLGKIVISILNVLLGSLFAYFYFKYFKKIGNMERKRSYTVLLILLSEFFFSIIPCFIFVFFRKLIIPYVNLNSGTIISLGWFFLEFLQGVQKIDIFISM